jgi:hypothetical protein
MQRAAGAAPMPKQSPIDFLMTTSFTRHTLMPTKARCARPGSIVGGWSIRVAVARCAEWPKHD